MASRATAALRSFGTAAVLREMKFPVRSPCLTARVRDQCRNITENSRKGICSARPLFNAKKQEVDDEPQEVEGNSHHQNAVELEKLSGEKRTGDKGDTTMAAGAEEIAKLKDQLVERDEKIGELQDRALRVLAEMENVRTIARRDVDNAKKYGISGFAKNLLTVADNLGLALNAVDPEKIEPGNELLRGLCDGVRATEKELQKTLANHGIVRFGKEGDIFDPNLHQAMFETTVSDSEAGTVISVTKTGYMIGDRVLRPAEVGVNKKA